MIKSINLEVKNITEEYAVLETENGNEFDIDLEYLPDNLKEGTYLKFVISNTDYNPNKVFTSGYRSKKELFIPNGKQLSY